MQTLTVPQMAHGFASDAKLSERALTYELRTRKKYKLNISCSPSTRRQTTASLLEPGASA